jgi:hypothetical protein
MSNEEIATNPLGPTVGDVLIAPTGSGPRETDVLCVIDADESEPGALFALVLNRPLDRPAQPLTFMLFDPGAAHAWWGGPTEDAFALVELPNREGTDDLTRPNGEPRPYVTERTGLWMPGRDHKPSAPERTRVFVGSVWLSADQCDLYARKGTVLRAKDEWLFDEEPLTLATRLRAVARDR